MSVLSYTDKLARIDFLQETPEMVLRVREEMNRLIIAATLYVLSNQPAWSAFTG